jgi:hypothetical protein
MARRPLGTPTPPVVPAEIIDKGWSRLLCSALGERGGELGRIRAEVCATFAKLAAWGALAGVGSDTFGQRGFTDEADEGEVGLAEVRSHYVFNIGLPTPHPLQRYAPYFYGGDGGDSHLESIRDGAERLHTILDALTLQVFEGLEEELNLSFGALAGPLAMGERLLRFQWYPRVSEGVGKTFVVDTTAGSIPIIGLERDGNRLVRASPHKDMGHWTWQVFATDQALRFWDERSNEVVPVESGDWIYGNVCEFLAEEHSALRAPLHWVDLADESCDRFSISYFAHARPGAMLGEHLSGLRLYERLEELGYATREDVESVSALLEGNPDGEVVARMLALGGGLSPGFAQGVERYYG